MAQTVTRQPVSTQTDSGDLVRCAVNYKLCELVTSARVYLHLTNLRMK
jgi:hypothetical protein